MNNKDKLEKIKSAKAKAPVKINNIGLQLSGIDDLSKALVDLKKQLGLPHELRGFDELIDQLGEITSLQDEVIDLKEAIADLRIPEMPDSVKVEGIDSLLERIEGLELPTPQVTVKSDSAKVELAAIATHINNLNKALLAVKATPPPANSQKPADFVPMRRVVAVGNSFIFDDKLTGGGNMGGGGISNALLPPDIDITTHINYIRKYYTSAGAATDGVVWSPATGKRWHVVSMYIQSSAVATATLEDDLIAGDDPVWKAEFVANQGMTINFGEKYPMASSEDAADLLITTSAGNIYITITGYEV